ncbi:hypothetical protein [Rhodococcus sp. CH91]|uniref:hypothetical protein n=1 Tax=Rhodococcus sp. CH91 TaxID=2910256 RepID=UPI001F4B6916|nr:hypothetical protein [Rhodococcus sp. CH91]
MTAPPPAPAPWDEAPKRAALDKVANMLANAGLTGRPALAADALLVPYARPGAEEVAAINFRRGVQEGCRVVGRAVTVLDTSAGEVGVGGYYFGGSLHATGTGIPDTLLVRPQLSAALALRVGTTLDRSDITIAEVLGSVEGVHAVLVVDCPRVGGPDGSTLLECIADNAHAGHIVLSDTWITPEGADFANIVLDVGTGDTVASYRPHPRASLHLVSALRRSIALFGPVSPGEMLVMPTAGQVLELAPGATARMDSALFGTVSVARAEGEYDDGFEPLRHANDGGSW